MRRKAEAVNKPLVSEQQGVVAATIHLLNHCLRGKCTFELRHLHFNRNVGVYELSNSKFSIKPASEASKLIVFGQTNCVVSSA